MKHKLKNKRSSGFDDISGYIIKNIYNLLIPVLTYLVNLTFCEGQFPTILKINKVIPIYKRGDSLLAENYRPVALISIFFKVLEYEFLSRLESFFDSRNILSPNQFGFRRDCSTMTAIQYFYEKLVSHMEGKSVLRGSLQISVGHLIVSTLLRKLEMYGIRGPALAWLSSFLRDRKQFVSLLCNDCSAGQGCFNSDVLSINTGVPQGSVLGPFLFITYINDLMNMIDPN